MRISDWSSDVCSSDLQPCFDRAYVRILEDSDNSACFGHQFALAFVSDGEAFGDNERALRPVVVAGVHLKISADKRGSVDFTFGGHDRFRSEEHTSELQSLMRISYAVFCLKKNNQKHQTNNNLTPH